MLEDEVMGGSVALDLVPAFGFGTGPGVRARA